MKEIIDAGRLMRLAEDNAAAYAAGDPFPHIVLDDFLPIDVIRELQAAFPGPDDAVWGSFDNKREVKLALRDETQMPEPQRDLLREFNGQVFTAFLTKLTGIEGMVPDPDYYGGGLHQILPGGVLKVHADFNLHPVTKLQRRINVLLYLNDDWDPGYGGNLELWDVEMTAAVKKVPPIANRLVVFSTTSESFHGHPDPLTCPPDRTRRSMAWYYYTLPQGRVVKHSTLFQSRPGEELYTAKEIRRQRVERIGNRVMAVAPPKLRGALRSAVKKVGR